MSEKSIINSLSWTLVGELVNKVTLFFATMYFAKILSADNFGLFSLYQAIAMYSVMLIEISPTMYATREIAKCDTKNSIIKKAKEIYGLRFYTGLLVGSIYIIILTIFQSDKPSFFIGVAFSFYIFAYAFFSDWLHKGLENFKSVAIASLMQAIIFIPLVIGFVTTDKDVEKAALFWSGSFLIFSFVLFLLQKKLLGRFIFPSVNIKKWKKNVLDSYHFVLNGILGMAYQYIPLFMLSYFSTMTKVGSFSLMYKLTFAVCGLAYYIPSVFYPKLSKSANTDFCRFKILQKKLLIIMVTISLAFISISIVGKSYFIGFFDQNKYTDISELYNIFSMLIITYLIRFSFNIPLLALGKQNVITKQMGYASLLVVILSIPLILYKDLAGAALALLFGGLFIVANAAYTYYRVIFIYE